MNSTNLPKMPPPSDSSFLQVGKRRFPVLRNQEDTYRRQAAKFELNPDESALRNELTENLYERLPYTQLEFYADIKREELVECYVNSLAQIGHYAEDVNRLVYSICETSLEFRQQSGVTNEEARDEAISSLLAELADRHKLLIQPAKNILDAKLVAQPVNDLHLQLKQALRDSVMQFVNQLFAGIEELVDDQCIGLIDWVGENVCRYHFFRQVVLQENDGVQDTLLGDVRFRGDLNSEGFSRGVQEVTEVTRGCHSYRHGRHEHHVMEAFHTSINASRVVMPPAAKQLVDQIPEWLRSHIRIVDGTIFRERIIEEDYRKETWHKAQTFDQPIFGYEPAVTLGQFVLTGWGPREIDAELDRRKKLPLQEDGEQSVVLANQWRPIWISLAGVSHCLSIFFAWCALRTDPSWSLLATAMLLIGVWSTFQAVRSHAIIQGLSMGWGRAAASAWSVGLMIAAIQPPFGHSIVISPMMLVITLMIAISLAVYGTNSFRSEPSLR